MRGPAAARVPALAASVAGVVAAAAAVIAAGPSAAHDGVPHGGDGPRPLVLSVGRSYYAVPEDGFESLGYRRGSGLELCLTDAAERDVADFTEAHLGEVVRVAIGETQVFALEVVEPYEGGCITWPVHPMVAANYLAMLTGEAPRMLLPPEGTGE